MSMIDYAKKAGGFLKDNKATLITMGLMMGPQICGATFGGAVQTNMPWDSGLTTLQTALTGPIPKAGAVISIASGGAMHWAIARLQSLPCVHALVPLSAALQQR